MATQVATPHAESQTAAAPWPLWRRIVFRFGFVYLALYCLPSVGRVSLLGSVPFAGYINETLAWPKDKLTLWAGTHLFHLQGIAATRHPTGSGDTALDWVECALFLALAVIATPLWSLLDRRRSQYRTLALWLRLLLRYTLAFTLLSYGFAKVFPTQFQPPFLPELAETYGASSPMGILWRFMGASTAYTMFSGWAEVTAGVLLLFRRTTTLGSLLAFAVLANVFMLNMCYDVPVKLYSFNLVIMSCVLALPESARPRQLLPPPQTRRTGNARSRTAEAPLAAQRWPGRSRSSRGLHVLRQRARHHDLPARDTCAPEIYGLWNVDSFLVDGKELPASDSRRWRQLVIEFPTWWPVYFTNASTDQNAFQVVAAPPNKLALLDSGGQTSAAFTWQRPDAQHLIFSGTLGKSPAIIRMSRYDEHKFLLTNRGFHWVSEYPYNR